MPFINNPSIADGIVSWLIFLFVSSKGELNHRLDDRANPRANDWVNNSRLVDHPGCDPRVGISAAHTALLTIGEAIGLTAETISLALHPPVG